MPTAPTDDDAPAAGALGRWLAHRLAGGGGPAWWLAWLRRRVQASPGAHAHYQRLRLAERLAAGRALGPAQAELVEQLLFAALAPPRRRAPALALGGLGAAAAALALVVVVVSRGGADDELRARGGEAWAVGVRARCVVPGALRVEASAEAGPRAPVGALRCTAGSVLAFSLTNLEPEPRYAFVVGVAADGSLRWLPPFEEGARFAPIAPGTVDEPLPVGAGVQHLAGDDRVTLHALFARAPLEGAAVARALRATSVPRGALSTLPIDEVAQARIEVRVERP